MNVFSLPRSLTIRTIRDVHHSITEWIGGSDQHVLDGQTVQELDTSGVQLLTSLLAASDAAAPVVTLIHPSAELRTALQRSGLSGLLQDHPTDNDEQTGNPS